MEKKVRSDYMERQIYMMSSIGIFYVILIALFAVPLLGTFVVVIIKGVLDFRMVILICGIVILAFFVFYLGKFIHRLWQKFRHGGFSDIGNMVKSGHPFQITFLNGLISVSSGNPSGDIKALPENIAMLPEPESGETDVIQKLKELSELKTQGIINDEEFDLLKKKLINALS